VGAKEDISEIIGLISPYDTPCYSQFRKTEAINPVVHWQEDELRAPKTNAVIEGADAGTFTGSKTGMVLNYTQLFEETAQVSSTAKATKFHGRADEMDFQVMKRGRELKRDIEAAFVGLGQAKAEGNNTDTARLLGGVASLINAATTTAAGGAGNPLTEALVLTTHEKVYNEGGDPTQLMVSPYHSTIVANFAYVDPTAGTASRTRDASEARLVNKVEIYDGPFGELAVVTNRWIRGSKAMDTVNSETDAGEAFLLEVDRWAVPELQPMMTEELAKTGHSEKKLVSCELTLMHENSKASGRISGLDTTP
jgi:hypothetical protein